MHAGTLKIAKASYLGYGIRLTVLCTKNKFFLYHPTHQISVNTQPWCFWPEGLGLCLVETAESGPGLLLGKLASHLPCRPCFPVVPQVEGGPAYGALSHTDATSILGDMGSPELGLLL